MNYQKVEDYQEYESNARYLIEEIHGETQWTQEIQKPAWAIAIICILMSIRDAMED